MLVKATVRIVKSHNLALDTASSFLQNDGHAGNLTPQGREPRNDAAQNPVSLKDWSLNDSVVTAAGRWFIIEYVHQPAFTRAMRNDKGRGRQCGHGN